MTRAEIGRLSLERTLTDGSHRSWAIAESAGPMPDTALIPVFAGRPPVLRVQGAWVYVSVHDQAHLTERARRRRALALKHPDAGGYAREFGATKRAYERWLRAEQAWYAALGLDLPAASLASPPAVQIAHGRCVWCGGLTRPTRQFCSRRHAMLAARELATRDAKRARSVGGTRRGDVTDPSLVALTLQRRRSSPSASVVRSSV